MNGTDWSVILKSSTTTKMNLCSFCTKSHDLDRKGNDGRGDDEGETDFGQQPSTNATQQQQLTNSGGLMTMVANIIGTRFETLIKAKRRKKTVRRSNENSALTVDNSLSNDNSVVSPASAGVSGPQKCVLCRGEDCESFNRCNEMLIHDGFQQTEKQEVEKELGNEQRNKEPNKDEQEICADDHEEALINSKPRDSPSNEMGDWQQSTKQLLLSQESSKMQPPLPGEVTSSRQGVADTFRSIDDLRAVNEYCEGRRSRREGHRRPKLKRTKKEEALNKETKSGRQDWDLLNYRKLNATNWMMTLTKLVAYLYFLYILINSTLLLPTYATANQIDVASHGNAVSETGVCQSIDIRNKPDDLVKLKNCRVIEGFLQILLIDQYDGLSFENYTFPLLTEITDFLLLFRVNGLRSIGQLFPNLAVIRGNALFNNFALIVYEVFDLEEIALRSLIHIGRGAVRVEKNPQLCYVKDIDWTRIAHNTVIDDHYFDKNKQGNECAYCPSNVTNPDTGYTSIACPPVSKDELNRKYWCWNQKYCQKLCPNECPGNCNKFGQCCSDHCIGGCTGTLSNCTACRHFSLGDISDRNCVKSCPDNSFEHMKRRCISETECLSIRKPIDVNSELSYPFIPFDKECRLHCPPLFDFVGNSSQRSCKRCAMDKCRKVCTSAKIDSIQAAQKMSACTYIRGSLEIQIRREGGLSIVKELEIFLSEIEEIEGYLKIARSDPFVSLSFLKKLKVIHGMMLDNKNSFILLDNENLQDIWSENQTVRIMAGQLLFHNNPKLCLNKIERLKHMLTPNTTFNLDEIAKNSNGDRTACNVTQLNVRLTTIVARSAIIEWDPVVMEDERSLIGYVVYHKPAPFRNVSFYDGRDACGFDGWLDDDVQIDQSRNNNMIFLFSLLEPYTQYAFYVKTYQIVTEKTGAQSAIQYFMTQADEPEGVRNLRARSNSSSEIIVTWDPPRRANGKLVLYMITCELVLENPSVLQDRDYCKLPVVPNMEPVTSTPPTEAPKIAFPPGQSDAHFCDCDRKKDPKAILAEKENQISFEDQLHNYVYVKRSQPKTRRRRSDEMILQGIGNSSVVRFPDDTDKEYKPKVRKDNVKNGTYYVHIYREVEVPITQIVIGELKHYSMYRVTVIACREGIGHGNCTLDTQNVNVRTSRDIYADNVRDFSVIREGSNSSQNMVVLTWKPPEDPNNFVISYRIKIQDMNSDVSQPIPKCIAANDFHNQNGIYSFPIIEPGNYSIQVAATSLAGEGFFSPPQFVLIKDPDHTWIWIGCCVGVAILIGLAAYIYRLKKQKQENMKLYASVNPDYVTMSYTPDEWEIPRDKIKQLRELGQGSFGMVYEGLVKVKDDEPEKECAIKTVNENATDRERMNFLQEASYMKGFDTHHVVRLLGVVSKGQPTLVVMELMAKGDLKGYLRSHRPDAEVPPNGEIPQPPGVKRFLQMAIEIADGMAYLAHKKFVHRDLAARNCMVSDDLTVKIGDFGMTRDIYETDYYRKGNKGLLPVRWMSPESLKDGVFSSYSDVFSYGVVLWEMATLASQPYQGLSNDQVLRYVIDGGVMERPDSCPDQLYDLMRKCWEHKPSARPTFIEIVTDLLPHVNPNFRKVSFYFSPAGEAYRNQLHQLEMQNRDDDEHARLRIDPDLSLDDGEAHLYIDHQNNNNNRHLVDAGPMPHIKPAHSPLR